ncbi:sulfur carrier protein ThiS [Neisseriaceae bacterium ESL0693]|nr:sulfur carrier protein ThiS [Neisseriaceae bacterium ESL0693]
MQISINGQNVLFNGQTINDLIAEQAPQLPFAIAVNTVFVPRQQYGEYDLKANDRVEIVHPVVGG